VAANRQIDRRFEPSAARERISGMRADWEKAIARAKAWI
jgi:hypothetical protein